MTKQFILSLAFAATALGAMQAYADDGQYSLKKLDLFQSCKPGTIQEKNGINALAYLEAFSAWHIKDQMNMLDPDMVTWHSSLAGLLEANPQLQNLVPFKNGQWTVATYVPTLAFLAYANDLDKYQTIPSRVDCIGDDTVVLITNFTGFQIRRDDVTGCVTHGLAFGSPAKIEVRFKKYAATQDAPERSLVYRVYSNLDDKVSAQVRVDLAKLVSGPPNVAPNPANCKTRKQILDDFQHQADNQILNWFQSVTPKVWRLEGNSGRADTASDGEFHILTFKTLSGDRE